MRRLRRLAATILVLMMFLGGPFNVAAQTDVHGVVDDAVLKTISEYDRPGRDILSSSVRRIGYQPPSQAVWSSSPAIAKLSSFVQAAENAQTGGGAKALAALAEDLSGRHDSIRRDAYVRRFIDQNPSTGPIGFSNAGSSTLASLSSQERMVISKISRVAEGKLGGAYGILTSHFGISQSRAFEIVARSANTSEALVQGYTSMDRAERRMRMLRLVSAAERAYPGIASERSVILFRTINNGRLGGGILDLGGDGVVECYCGGRYIGRRPASQCVEGTPCR